MVNDVKKKKKLIQEAAVDEYTASACQCYMMHPTRYQYSAPRTLTASTTVPSSSNMAKRVRHASTSSAGSAAFLSAHAPKCASLEPDDRASSSAMRCSLPPHKPQSFATYTDYEAHYTQAHTNRCTECNTNLPSSHFLGLHIAENHDPLQASKRDKGEKTYACFVDDCEKVCRDWTKRRSHLVDKHGFPRNYDFFIVNTGVDGRRSMLRPGVDAQGHRKSSRERSASSVTETSESTEATSVSEKIAEEAVATEDVRRHDSKASTPQVKSSGIDELAESMSSLKMVPRSITFGRRKGGGGLAKS
ncbi:hypothetical protein LTR56_022640 [Elasticomyces elasticus]|nr:hypothetical protein LTR22_026074 [Elasticomyces elasticus]KAK3621673.1 hypothetical protein LTR56_022640 [Elasticomyces elasticus]KAK4921885.1 hypothetical protein LTR49_010658 [Elasticomyces elasticus]